MSDGSEARQLVLMSKNDVIRESSADLYDTFNMENDKGFVSAQNYIDIASSTLTMGAAVHNKFMSVGIKWTLLMWVPRDVYYRPACNPNLGKTITFS